MTVSSTTSKVTYTGNGSTTAFAVPFNFFLASDLQVIERIVATGTETTKALTTDYTVTGGGGGTGTVTAVIAPPGTVQWTIKRVLPRTQGMDLTPNDPFPANTVEESHDRAVMLVQELEEQLARALKFPSTDSISLSANLPSSVDRASKFLAFDAQGTAIAASGTSTNLGPVSGFINTLLDDADAATARATLGTPALIATETVVGGAELATDAEVLAGTDDARITTPVKIGGWLGRTIVPGGRLTLTAGIAISTSDVTAAGTIYYTPYAHNLIQIWNGARWQVYPFSELTLVLEAAQQLSGKNYDMFLFDSGGLVTLGTGSAWANDTVRTDTIARKDGRWTNSASITIRTNGANNNVATNRALYIGTIRMTANAQTEDSAAKRFVWNVYHRARRSLKNVLETVNSYNYSTTIIRQANANSANQLDFVVGLAEDAVSATVIHFGSNTNSAPFFTGIGLDSTSAFASDSYPGAAIGQTTHQPISATAVYRGLPGIGRHFLAWLELPTAAATSQTWYGDNNTSSTLQSGMVGELMS